MWKSLIYKEWLKTRWFLLVYFLLSILSVAYIFLKVQHEFKFNDAKNYWYFILFMGGQYFSYLKFIPVTGALLIGISQYFPETVNKRIKLTFHLPMNENRALLTMTLFGFTSLVILYLVQLLLFTGLSMFFFPSDIIFPALTTVFPWMLSGLILYNFIAFILLEPVWKYRVLFVLATATIVPLYLQPSGTSAYSGINLVLTLITLITGIALFYSGYRFRKGEM